MTFKKVLSVVLALAMVLSLGMTAFATASTTDLEGEEGYEMEIGSSTQVATIKVQVPNVVGFIVNPYKLEASNAEIGIDTAAADDSQIVSPLQRIVNKSDFKIKVGGTIYSYENNPDEAKLVSTITTTEPPTGFAKEAKIHFLATAGAATGGSRLELASAPTTNGCNVDLKEATAEAGKALTDVTLGDKSSTTDCAYIFNFDGEAQSAPATSWTDADTFGATIAFTFTAVANTAGGSGGGTTYAVTVNTPTGGSGSGTATAAASPYAAGASVEITVTDSTATGATLTVKKADGTAITPAIAVTEKDNTDSTLNDGKVYTFTMPAEAVQVDVALT